MISVASEMSGEQGPNGGVYQLPVQVNRCFTLYLGLLDFPSSCTNACLIHLI